MAQLAARDYKNAVLLKKIGGLGLAVGTQFLMLNSATECNNPTNTSYPVLINSAVSIVNGVRGRKTPNITITAVWKGSTISAALLYDLLVQLDSNGDTSLYSIGIYDADLGTFRVYDECRCSGMVIACAAIGGAIGIQMSFLARYGDSEAPSPATFTTPVVDPGFLTPVSQINFAGTATLATGFQLAIVRAQGYLAYFDQTLYMSGTASGMLTGALNLVQTPRANTVPSSSFILQVGQTGTGVQIASYVNLDSLKRDYTPSLGSMTNNFSLVDLNNSSGNGQAIVISSF